MGAAESSDTEKASVEQVVQRYRSQIDAEAKLRQKCFDDAHGLNVFFLVFNLLFSCL